MFGTKFVAIVVSIIINDLEYYITVCLDLGNRIGKRRDENSLILLLFTLFPVSQLLHESLITTFCFI